MAHFVTDKRKITQAVMSLLSEQNQESDIERALFHWWRNPRSGGGLRLSDVGDKKFTEAQIDFTEFTESSKIYDSWYVIDLDRKLSCPYYLSSPSRWQISVKIYDDRIATLIILYGSLREYINSLEGKYNDR